MEGGNFIERTVENREGTALGVRFEDSQSAKRQCSRNKSRIKPLVTGGSMTISGHGYPNYQIRKKRRGQPLSIGIGKPAKVKTERNCAKTGSQHRRLLPVPTR